MTREPLPIRSENDVVLVRQATRQSASELGFTLVDLTKIVTAASELARNMLIYGGGGEVTLELLQQGIRHGLRAEFVDAGPGIPDINLALRDGFTTDNGNLIIDVHGLSIVDPVGLEARIRALAGVVTVGLFAQRGADVILVGTGRGVDTIEPAARTILVHS